jgi:hypothetical protein
MSLKESSEFSISLSKHAVKPQYNFQKNNFNATLFNSEFKVGQVPCICSPALIINNYEFCVFPTILSVSGKFIPENINLLRVVI